MRPMDRKCIIISVLYSNGIPIVKNMEFLFVVSKINVRRERTERRAHTLSTVRVTVAMMIDNNY